MKYFLPVLLLVCFACTSPNSSETEAVQPEQAVTDSLPARPVIAKDDTTVFRMPPYEYLTGKFNPNDHPDFVKVADKYTDGDPYLLHKDTYAAFEKMHAAAMADNVQLIMVSATRNFQRQKQIWEAKWKGNRLLEGKEKANVVYPDPADRARAILRYSSMPGTSRHHWGTDIDLNALTNEFFDAGTGKKVYDWLVAHAHEYGFCQTYTPKGPERPNGYEEERWHWSYLPIAQILTDFAANELQDEDISGFMGAEAAPQIGVLENYVLGINRACKE
jgi:D-alanyl-D-alanine carboxypeptidase